MSAIDLPPDLAAFVCELRASPCTARAADDVAVNFAQLQVEGLKNSDAAALIAAIKATVAEPYSVNERLNAVVKVAAAQGHVVFARDPVLGLVVDGVLCISVTDQIRKGTKRCKE